MIDRPFNLDDLNILERAKHFAAEVERRTRFRGWWAYFVCRRSVNSSAQNFVKAIDKLLAENEARASQRDKSKDTHS